MRTWESWRWRRWILARISSSVSTASSRLRGGESREVEEEGVEVGEEEEEEEEEAMVG